MDIIGAMRLEPTSAPGNAQRKARAFAAEIKRLRSEGYTIEVIRQTLASAGVVVGWSTVQREAAREDAGTVTRPVQPAAAAPTPTPSPLAPSPTQRTRTRPEGSGIVTAPAPVQVLKSTLSAKDLAEQFVRGQIGNSLVRKRGKS